MSRAAFTRFTAWAARAAGSPPALLLSLGVCVAWALTDSTFGFLDATSLLTFLLAVIIQATQNRDAAALHAKLDGIINALEPADSQLMRAEERDVREIEELRPSAQA
jgi:low affinity Fe/Cu permease